MFFLKLLLFILHNMIYYENIFLSSFQFHLLENFYHGCYIFGGLKHASGLTAEAKIWPIEFQNQWAVPIRSLAFWPVDGRLHPVSGSMDLRNHPYVHIEFTLKMKDLKEYINRIFGLVIFISTPSPKKHFRCCAFFCGRPARGKIVKIEIDLLDNQ